MEPADLRHWWVKAAAQGAVAVLPGGSRLDDWVRRRRGARLESSYVDTKWVHVQSHLRAMGGREGTVLDGRPSVVELGTGWFPIVAVGMALHGARVLTVDTRAHLDGVSIASTLRLVVGMVEAGELTVPDGPRLGYARRLLSRGGPVGPEDLQELGVTSYVGDARDLSGCPSAHGARLMFSNNTLEHIPGPVLEAIFAEFGRVAGPGARMSHYVDLADHYAAFDPRAGDFHFLSLPPLAWRLANNRLGYQNRLRIGDYRDLHARTGWAISRERLTRREPEALRGLRLVPPYDTMPADDVLVVKAHLVSSRVSDQDRPPCGQGPAGPGPDRPPGRRRG